MVLCITKYLDKAGSHSGESGGKSFSSNFTGKAFRSECGENVVTGSNDYCVNLQILVDLLDILIGFPIS